jgi:hypothetical protein
MTPISPDQYETFCFTCGACVGKPWVGLTDEEIDAIYRQNHNQYNEDTTGEYERDLEAKLKEKNGG